MEAHLVPKTALAKIVTVIAAEDDDGVVHQAGLLQGVQKDANLVVNVGAVGKVGSSGPLDVFWSEIAVDEVDDLKQSLRVRVLLLLGNLVLGERNVDILVAVPVLLASGVRVCSIPNSKRQT